MIWRFVLNFDAGVDAASVLNDPVQMLLLKSLIQTHVYPDALEGGEVI